MSPAQELDPKSPLFNAMKRWHGGYFDSQSAPWKDGAIPGFSGSQTRISASQKLCAAPAAEGQLKVVELLVLLPFLPCILLQELPN